MSKSKSVDTGNVNDKAVKEEETKRVLKKGDDNGLSDDGDSSFIDGTKGEEIKDPADDKKRKKAVKGKENRNHDNKDGASASRIVANVCGWCGTLSTPTFIGLAIGFSNPLFLIGSGCGLVVAIVGFVVNDNLNFDRSRYRLFSGEKNTPLEQVGKNSKKNDHHNNREFNEDEDELGDDLDNEEQPQKSGDKEVPEGGIGNLLKMFGGGSGEKIQQNAGLPPMPVRPQVPMSGIPPSQPMQAPPSAPVATPCHAPVMPYVAPYHGAPVYGYANPTQPIMPYQPAIGLPQAQVQFPPVNNH